jgi:uncharacterized protein (TIGR02996 family)
MPDRPKAHRRLVPRVPKKEPDDADATKKRPALRETPRPVVDTSTRQRELEDLHTEISEPDFEDQPETLYVPRAGFDDLEVTVQREPVLPPEAIGVIDDFADEERDAAETIARMPAHGSMRPSLPPAVPRPRSARRPAEPPPEPEPARPPAPPPMASFVLTAAGETPPAGFAYGSTRASDPGLPFALDAANAKFRPAATEIHEPEHGYAPAIPDPDPDAFADLEPTALKAPTSLAGAEVRPTTHLSPAERGLLAAMAEGHEASRLVYMNWLERRGERQRAEFLRVEHQLASMNPLDLRCQEMQERLRILAQAISVDWRSRVARSPIENCHNVMDCPRYWRALPAEADDVRQCGRCGEHVYYCVTIELARARVQANERVALDVTVERTPGDLEPHCAACGSSIPHGTRFCPHCGCALY